MYRLSLLLYFYPGDKSLTKLGRISSLLVEWHPFVDKTIREGFNGEAVLGNVQKLVTVFIAAVIVLNRGEN